VAGAEAGCPTLPENRAGEEEGLARPPQAHPDELREEDAEALVEVPGSGLLNGHGVEDLLLHG